MTTRKSKLISIRLFEIKGYFLSSTLQVLCDQVKDKENVYVISRLTYRNYRISLNKSIEKYNVINGLFINKDDINKENKKKELMEKNKNITIKELIK